MKVNLICSTTMKAHALTIFSFFLISTHSFSQPADHSPLRFNVGLRYQIGDSEFGPLLGIAVKPYGSKFSYRFRTDVTFKLGELQQQAGYGITSLSSFSFVDISYSLAKSFKSGLGLGWAYGRVGDNNLFNVENGYSYGTISLVYSYEWLSVEGRLDLPFMNDAQKVNLSKASMVSLSVYASIPNIK